MKAISYRMSFASDKKTLSSEEVANIQNSVIKALEKAGYPLK
jgi:phenylalanyl-tRNA synthetase beta subunit